MPSSNNAKSDQPAVATTTTTISTLGNNTAVTVTVEMPVTTVTANGAADQRDENKKPKKCNDLTSTGSAPNEEKADTLSKSKDWKQLDKEKNGTHNCDRCGAANFTGSCFTCFWGAGIGN